MATLYFAPSNPGTTGGSPAAPIKTATSTGLKVIQQIAPSTTRPIKVVEWGISFDGSSAATPIQVELVQADAGTTGLTAYTTSIITPFDDPNGPSTTVTLGTSASGYAGATAVADTTIASYRYGDLQLVAPTNGYVKQYPLGREFQVPISKFLKVRVTAGTGVNAYSYVIYEE